MRFSPDDFEAFHTAIHGYAPFEWQSRLLRQIVEDRQWPRVLDLPTGAGKTTCLDIALYALALDASRPPHERWAPRRIAMVIDRRIVVDQAAERGQKLARKLWSDRSVSIVARVAAALRSMSGGEDPVGVYTLRGGMPKDDGWTRTPDQPLILSSTVDQLGSRLFVQGYGVSRGMRPVHAGLLGNDALLLLDEVHLSQPFAQTLDALARLRRGGALGLPNRFMHAFLSATPGEVDARAFCLREEETRAGSALAARLHARKPARLEVVQGRAAVEGRCVDEAVALSREHNVVGVVLNRVASAQRVADELRRRVGERVDVTLLTGRMRPLDRDDVLRDLRSRVVTGRERSDEERGLILVGTQCIEAGADFDLDALVTECASIDALRQRFGRVDRIGQYGRAQGVIVGDKTAKDDPIYANAIVNTIEWLLERRGKKGDTVDFGPLALSAPPANTLAPRPSAPALLPAYLDLWSQTSPEAALVPDLGLFLHGPDAGPADVQIVWRADVREEDLAAATLDDVDSASQLASIVASVRPLSLEALSLPFISARRWLSDTPRGSTDLDALDVADVERQRQDAPGSPGGGRALRWRGDESTVIDATGLRPGDTIVVPVQRGGISRGCFDPNARHPAQDMAERTSLFGRGIPALRLQADVLSSLGLDDVPRNDAAEARAWLRRRSETESGWSQRWLQALADGSGRLVVDRNDESWLVLDGDRLSASELRDLVGADGPTMIENAIDITTDEEDSFHAGRAVALAAHSNDVERFAREYASRLGLSASLVSDLALAGWLHDIGKADRRFQVMLRGGSEIDLFKDETLWAKSSMANGDRVAQRVAQQRSRYPKGARHEVQSVAMIAACREWVAARACDLELVLHLIGSHHGHCRPFAPAVDDPDPVNVTLAGHTNDVFGSIVFPPVSSKNELHRLGSAVGDRFWQLVEKYGWLELCWLEAILRLADHRASEMEQRGGEL